MSKPVILYDFFRPAAAYRLRIALNIKGIALEYRILKLFSGEHRSADYLRLNPQGLVPSLILDAGTVLTQSLAIIEWIDSAFPAIKMLFRDSVLKAKVRAYSLVIAADTHLIQNLAVLNRLRKNGLVEENVSAWAKDSNQIGLDACEVLARQTKTPFCFGKSPSITDIYLVQLFNRRFKWLTLISKLILLKT